MAQTPLSHTNSIYIQHTRTHTHTYTHSYSKSIRTPPMNEVSRRKYTGFGWVSRHWLAWYGPRWLKRRNIHGIKPAGCCFLLLPALVTNSERTVRKRYSRAKTYYDFRVRWQRTLSTARRTVVVYVHLVSICEANCRTGGTVAWWFVFALLLLWTFFVLSRFLVRQRGPDFRDIYPFPCKMGARGEEETFVMLSLHGNKIYRRVYCLQKWLFSFYFFVSGAQRRRVKLPRVSGFVATVAG